MSEVLLRQEVGSFSIVCNMKVNAFKSKVMVLNEEEGLECEVQRWDLFRVHLGIQIFGMCLDESGTIGQNVVGRWQVGGGWQMSLGP